MIEAVIFDWGRTIYDPESQQLFPQTEQVLSNLTFRQLRLGLVSIADTSIEDRHEDLRRFGISHFFQAVQIFGRREQKDFTEVLQGLRVEASRSAVVGDNLGREITLGNRIGAYTIWTRQRLSGVYVPRNAEEMPKAIIEAIPELVSLIDKLNA